MLNDNFQDRIWDRPYHKKHRPLNLHWKYQNLYSHIEIEIKVMYGGFCILQELFSKSLERCRSSWYESK
jgi:hypothetical protein